MNEKEHQLHLKLLKEQGAYWRPNRYTFAINPFKSSKRHGIQRGVVHITRTGFFEFQHYDFENPRKQYSTWAGRNLEYARAIPRTPNSLREVTLCGLLAFESVDEDTTKRVCKACYKADIQVEEEILRRLALMSREKKPRPRDKRGRFASKPAP